MTPRQLRLAAVLVAVAVAAVHVRDSQRAGRLSQDLTYDDVSYVVDAAGRLQEAAMSGPRGLLLGLWRQPPHSPYSTALAMLGLTAFGFTDAAVYWANALLLVGVTLLLLHLFREEPPWLVALLVGVYLTGALAGRTVTEFRPDLALGVCTAAFVFTLLRGALRQRPAEVTQAGALLGLALLVKPSFFPHTLALACAAGGLLLLFRALGQPLVPWRAVVRGAALGLAIAVPHYLLAGRTVLGYLWTNTRGAEAHLWLFPGSMGFWRVLYHFTIDPRSEPFRFAGRDLYLLLAATAAGIGLHAVRRQRREVLLLLGLAAAALASVVIVTAGRMDNDFFASTFQCLLLLAGFSALGDLARAVGPGPRAGLVFSVVVAALHVVLTLGNPPRPWSPPPDALPGTSWNDRLVLAVRADLEARGLAEDRGRRVSVFVTAAGAVNAATLLWSCQKLALPADVTDLHRAETEEELARAALAADYVVVPNPARAAVLAWLPPAPLQPALLGRLRAAPELAPVAAGTRGDPDRYFVFANRTRLAARSRS